MTNRIRGAIIALRLARMSSPADVESPRRSNRRQAIDAGVLLLLGTGLVIAAYLLHASHDYVKHPQSFVLFEVIQFAFFVAAAAWVLVRRPSARVALPIIVLIALAARLVLASGVPYASSDIYRYIWDGKVQVHGINPYRYAPQADALKSLQDTVTYPFMNRRWVPTIYPPVAQFTFVTLYLIHPNSIDWTRLAFSLFDVGIILLIALALKRVGSRPERVVLYAWHPLAIFEIGNSGHVDVVAVLLLLLALQARLSRRPILTGAALAAAALIKYYALVAAPALLTGNWRRDLKFGAGFLGSTLIAYVPYISVGKRVLGFLPGYVKEEGFASGGRFYILDRLGEYAHKFGWQLPQLFVGHHLNAAHVYDLALVLVMGGLAIWVWRKPVDQPQEIARRVLLLFMTLLVLSTPSYPWYALLPLSLLPFAGRRLFGLTFYATGTALLLYLQWWLPGMPHWPLKVVYGGGFLILAAAATSYLAMLLLRRRLTTFVPRRTVLQSSQEA